MGHQIRFFLCDTMRAAIEDEAQHVGAILVESYPRDRRRIQFSRSSGTDSRQGRLWTEAKDLRDYKALCRAVKKHSVYDHEWGLWVKRASRAAFNAWSAEKKKALTALVEENRKHAVKVLGARVVNNKG